MSKSAKRSRWDDDGDLARSALDLKRNCTEDELESRDLLFKVATTSSQLSLDNPFDMGSHLALSMDPVSCPEVAESVQESPRWLGLTSLDPEAFQNRPMYATQRMHHSIIPTAHSSGRHISRSHVATTSTVAMQRVSTPLILSLRHKKTNRQFSQTMKAVAGVLEDQYINVLKKAAEKTGEAAALYYLHSQTDAFNTLLDQYSANTMEISSHTDTFNAYKTWRSNLKQIVPNESFSSNPLASEQQHAFLSGLNSAVVQATQLALLEEGDKWLANEFLVKLTRYQSTDPRIHNVLVKILGQLDIQTLQLSAADKGNLTMLMSEVLTV